MTIQYNTPIIEYKVKGRSVYVKREDLCIKDIAFSKVRGIQSHLEKRPEKIIGVLDTFHSKAGWGVSKIGRELGKKVVVFYPHYKGQTDLRPFQKNCRGLGAEIIPLQAGRSAILYHQAKKHLRENYANSYMMPNALQIPESIEENCMEAYNYIPKKFYTKTVLIISISSGTIASGVLRGFYLRNSNNKVYIHMGYTRSTDSVYKKIYSSLSPSVFLPGINLKLNIEIIDEGYQYKDFVKIDCPFPCNPYYDRKAWKWLNDHIEEIPSRVNILFWNIGA